MAISKQTRIAKAYRLNMDAGNAQLDLALAYSEDGAPDSGSSLRGNGDPVFEEGHSAPKHLFFGL